MILNKSNPCWCPLEFYLCNHINVVDRLVKNARGAGDALKRTISGEKFLPFAKRHLPDIPLDDIAAYLEFAEWEEATGERSFAV